MNPKIRIIRVQSPERGILLVVGVTIEGRGSNKTVAEADNPGGITNPPGNSVPGLSEKITPPMGGFDLSTVRVEPPWLVRRMTTLVVVRPEDVPISMVVVQPLEGIGHSGIVVYVPWMVVDC